MLINEYSSSTIEKRFEKYGFDGLKDKDVRVFLREEFDIVYTRQYVNRLLHNIGISLQVPRPKHKRRNQQAVDEFKVE